MIRKSTTVILLAPASVLLLSLTLVPAIGIAVLSFFNWTTSSRPTFIGLSNFTSLMHDDSFLNALKVTCVFVVAAALIEVLLGVLVALCLEQWPRWRNALRIVVGIPLIISPAMTGILWKLGLNEQTGKFAQILNWFSPQPVRPLSSSVGAVCTIICIDVWQWTPLVILLLSVALEGFKEKLGDLTSVDGLSSTRAFFHVWRPLIFPTLGVAALLRTIDTLKVFDIVQTATAGGPGGASEVLSFYAYKQLIKFGNIGYAASIAVVLLLIATLLWSLASKVFFRPWEERL